MMYMKPIEGEYILSVLSQTKRKRIEEERRLHERLNISYDQDLSAVDHMVDALQKSGKSQSFKSYLRPRRGKR